MESGYGGSLLTAVAELFEEGIDLRRGAEETAPVAVCVLGGEGEGVFHSFVQRFAVQAREERLHLESSPCNEGVARHEEQDTFLQINRGDDQSISRAQ